MAPLAALPTGNRFATRGLTNRRARCAALLRSRALMGMGRRLGALGFAALFVAGCGGGERQDENEPEGTFDVAVVDADFPTRQHIAEQSRMRITVRNPGEQTIPNVAVTVKGFSTRSPQPGLADPNKPVWIVDSGPRGGDTAYVGTWALGALEPGRTRVFEWRVTPTVPGRYEVSYEVNAGLDGKAKARGSEGEGPPGGSFNVAVSGEAPQSRVDPETGAVVREDGDS
jgi:hypothetical protein